MSLVNPIPGNGVLVLENLLNIREWQHKIPWEPFAGRSREQKKALIDCYHELGGALPEHRAKHRIFVFSKEYH
jgi:hypothetical protein